MSEAVREPRAFVGGASSAYAKDKEVLLEVTDLKKYFPIKSGIVFQREVAAVKAVDGVSFKVYKAKRSRPGGRKRLRPIDHRAHDSPALSPDLWQREVRRAGNQHAQRRGAAPDAPRDADDLPGPLRLAQPAYVGRAHRGRAARGPQHRDQERARGARGGATEMVGLNPYFVRRYPHEFYGRAAAAHRAWRARWRSTRRSTSRTSRSRRWTCRSRRRW